MLQSDVINPSPRLVYIHYIGPTVHKWIWHGAGRKERGHRQGPLCGKGHHIYRPFVMHAPGQVLEDRYAEQISQQSADSVMKVFLTSIRLTSINIRATLENVLLISFIIYIHFSALL